MRLVKEGKTKRIYQLENGLYRIQFLDWVTGTAEGGQDSGANERYREIAGVGHANFMFSIKLFKMLEDKGIKTHLVEFDVDKGYMDVIPCTPFGGENVECIWRRTADGSFLRRYGKYAYPGQLLNVFEITLKDDERKDPPINEEALIALNMMTHEDYATLRSLTERIGNLIINEMKSHGIDVPDLKVEFGKDKDGVVRLIDELGPGIMRTYVDGVQIKDGVVIYKMCFGE